MKKSSIIIAAFLVGGSIVLLWAWSYFGFDQIDYPSSLLLCIVWWVLIVAAVSLVIHAEHKRREAIRTIYVGPRVLFNSEQGIVACPDPVARVSVMYEMLKSLTYNFRKEGSRTSTNSTTALSCALKSSAMGQRAVITNAYCSAMIPMRQRI